MKKFPIVIVDDFYEDPDFVRDFALSLDYYPSNGSYPGTRTKDLSLVNEHFFQKFVSKLLSLFFDFENIGDSSGEIITSFQKINKFSTDKKDIKNSGWIHADEYVISGIVYLNPEDHLYGGTNVYKLKSGEKNDCLQKTRYLHHLKSDKFNEEEYSIEKNYNNQKFIETIKIHNVYNRLVLFEDGVPHGVPTYYSESDEPRLTQVFFINQLVSSSLFPIIRSKIFDVLQ